MSCYVISSQDLYKGKEQLEMLGHLTQDIRSQSGGSCSIQWSMQREPAEEVTSISEVPDEQAAGCSFLTPEEMHSRARWSQRCASDTRVDLERYE